jgi:hypothetical protein
MALIDVQCLTCDTVSPVYRKASDWPQTPPCPKCESPTVQIHLPPRVVIESPAVVVYEAPDGSFRYPGDPNGRTVQHYESLGYKRVEAKGWAAVRSLEGRVSKQQFREICDATERRCQFRETALHYARSEMFNGLRNSFAIPELDDQGNRTGRTRSVKLSPSGRAVAEAAMSRNNDKPTPTAKAPGFFVEVFTQDRSNREEGRRSDGKRWRD